MKVVALLKTQSQVEILACAPLLDCGCITGIPAVAFDLDSQNETLPGAVGGVDRGFALRAESQTSAVALGKTEGPQGRSVPFSGSAAEW